MDPAGKRIYEKKEQTFTGRSGGEHCPLGLEGTQGFNCRGETAGYQQQPSRVGIRRKKIKEGNRALALYA